ncbi:MAG: hypothetical protein QGH51_08190 [Planctomycetota bacterium]|jgi:hypothetical protein|nr:hypothetical protein [Planctomycetota bacterium]MDP6941987.1 hypothetical protein [Planctomycetota bacterium]
MIPLIWSTLREVLSPWAALLLLLWVWVAGQLSFGPLPGAESLGSLVAFLSLVPILLLFQSCRTMERRKREAWRLEEQIRNPSGLRMPFAEWIAATALVGLFFLAAAALHHRNAEARRQYSNPISYPLYVSHQDGSWHLQHLGSSLPESAQVSALLTWETAPPADSEGFAETWQRPITPEEAREGIIREKLPLGAVVHPEFARLLLSPRDGPGLHTLLLGQFFFFLPLFSLAFLLVRRGVRSELAALGSLSIGGLASWQDPAFVLSRVQYWMRFGADLLPDVGSLFSVGRHYLLFATGVSTFSLFTWVSLGCLACFLSSLHPKKK